MASVSVHGRRLEFGGGAYVPDPSRRDAARIVGAKPVDRADQPAHRVGQAPGREERSDREQHDYRAGGKTLPAEVRPPRQRWP